MNRKGANSPSAGANSGALLTQAGMAIGFPQNHVLVTVGTAAETNVSHWQCGPRQIFPAKCAGVGACNSVRLYEGFSPWSSPCNAHTDDGNVRPHAVQE